MINSFEPDVKQLVEKPRYSTDKHQYDSTHAAPVTKVFRFIELPLSCIGNRIHTNVATTEEFDEHYTKHAHH